MSNIATESHYELMLERLSLQYRDKAKLAKVLSILSKQAQAIETMFQDMLVLRYLANASAQQLDDIGLVVGQARYAMDDDEFRLYIRIRIKANASSGTMAELLEILRLLVPATATIHAREERDATLRLRVGAVATEADFASKLNVFMKKARAAGVGHRFETALEDADTVFTLDSGGLGLGYQLASGSIDPAPSGNPIDANTFALWHMDESGTAIVDSVNGWTLSATGNVQVTPGLVGNGRRLLDTSARLSTLMSGLTGLHSLLTTAAFSVSWWMDLEGVALGGTRNVLVAGSSAIFTVQLSTAGRFSVFVGTGGTNVAFSATGAVPSTGRTHVEITVTHDGGLLRTVTVYVNGVVSGTPTQLSPTSFAASSGSLSFGHTSVGTSPACFFDELRFSTGVRTQSEVIQSMARAFGAGGSLSSELS